MTRQREEILGTIMGQSRHMTAEEIYDAVRLRMPGIARATVYRNLGLMERDGQVRRVRIAGAPDRFDRTLTPHEHIICPRCGALEDMPAPWLRGRLEQELGRPVEEIELNVRALCSCCARQTQ